MYACLSACQYGTYRLYVLDWVALKVCHETRTTVTLIIASFMSSAISLFNCKPHWTALNTLLVRKCDMTIWHDWKIKGNFVCTSGTDAKERVHCTTCMVCLGLVSPKPSLPLPVHIANHFSEGVTLHWKIVNSTEGKDTCT